MNTRRAAPVAKRSKAGGVLFVLSGPSGSGKTTLAQKLLEDKGLKKEIALSVSFTTRPPRRGERGGKDYFFISEEEFRRRRRDKKVLEWTKYLGYYYGTAADFVDEQRRKNNGLLFCLDIRGARRMKRIFRGSAVTVFLMPPSLEELRRRIVKRCAMESGELNGRLEQARHEMRMRSWFDYVVVNDDLAEASAGLKAIIRKELAAVRRPVSAVRERTRNTNTR